MWSSERPPCCPTTVFLKQGATRWLYSFLGWRLGEQNCRQLSALLRTVALPMLAWAQSLDVHISSPAVMGTVLGRTCQLTPAVMGTVLGTYLTAHSWHSLRKVRAIARAGMGIVLGTYVPVCSWHGHSPWNVRASQSAGMGIILGTYVPTCSWHGHSPRNVRASQSADIGIVLGTYVPANQLVSAESSERTCQSVAAWA